ncbi:hypothetical protein ONE63_008147 [Megalurothrips usitatus]|uniref:Mutator-like transposase domain-containing protein n=1 Tax=Megalurothrips usitatus TaxID=439358 RepID=A0AAV7XRT9_9NEOP|nr:hypothetical protein ONE63_008147 [Megalurothrips usitatus]
MPFMKAKERARREKVGKASVERHAKNRVLKASREQADYIPVSVGHRVVDLAMLTSNLWCTNCDAALSLKFLEEEKQYGLASEFSVRCPTCLDLKKLFTSKTVPCPSGDGRSLYSVNCKAALGCLDSDVPQSPSPAAPVAKSTPRTSSTPRPSRVRRPTSTPRPSVSPNLLALIDRTSQPNLVPTTSRLPLRGPSAHVSAAL